LDQLITSGSYHLNGSEIDTVTSHKDLGILFDKHLKFQNHTTEVSAKANRVLGMIKRSFEHLDTFMISRLFTTLIRPILEYSNSVWGPYFVLDQCKVEKVQRRAMKMIVPLQDMTYEERLSIFQLPSLSHRRLRGNLIMLYKILNNYCNSDFTDLYTLSSTLTRGHQLKLFKHHSRLLYRSNYFFTNDWNQLPASIANSNSINI